MNGIDTSKVFIIAEAGVNHNGDIRLAYKLVDAAKEAGADAVKFQTFKVENVVSKIAEKAEYQKETTNSEESQYEMIKKLELSFEDFVKIKDYCDKKG
ncbi:MAG: N-acetylneuraminate synthase family protein, partial [Thermoplasmata archaeon]|nr:N-acetylneuraminate synthase family protein [Thermoplasmata archaeon]